MASWDDDDFEAKLPDAAVVASGSAAKLPGKSDWEDEDEEDATLKEVASAPAATAASPAAPEVFKEKHRKKEVEREKERKEAEERAAHARHLAAQGVGVPLDDPVAEKKRLEALQERADLELARESLGLGSAADAADAPPLGKDAKSLIAAVTLGDADSFKTLGAVVAARVTAATGKTTASALVFYKELLRDGCERLSVDDISQLATLLTVQTTKKRQAAKAAAPAKKSAPAKKLHVGRDDDYSYDTYDDYGDVDAPAAVAAAAAPKAGAGAPGAEAGAAPAAAASLDGDFM